MDRENSPYSITSVPSENSVTDSEFSLLEDTDVFNDIVLDKPSLKEDLPVNNGNCDQINSTDDQHAVSDDGKEVEDEEVPELNFKLNPETLFEQTKRKRIEHALRDPNTTLEKWQSLARYDQGLIDDKLRKTIWPKLLEVDDDTSETPRRLGDLSDHSEYNQVILDVNRSLKRFPPGIPYDQRIALQDQLTVLILRVIMKYPELRYYQGYHDVAITILLVVGEVLAFRILERLSTEHLRECMEPTMEKTSCTLNFVYPIIEREHFQLYEHLERSTVGTMFALPWYLTWFGHSLNHYKDVVRLYDYFLASPPLAPLYVAAALVMERAEAIFATDCDMASLHSLLSTIPDDLPFEKILCKASELYKQYPPSDIEKDVELRIKAEKDARKKDEDRSRRRQLARMAQRQPLWRQFAHFERFVPVWVPRQHAVRYRVFLATATFAIGVFAYLRSNDSYYNLLFNR